MSKNAHVTKLLEQHHVRVTEPRVSVLDVLIKSGAPLRAYDILERMKTPQRDVNPPTVYRALEALEAAGIVHRLESLNAYIFCDDHAKGHSSEIGHELCFAICDECGDVKEIERDISPSLATTLEAQGFEPSKSVFEVHGRCAGCRK